MFYYRKDYENGSFEIKSSKIELNELDYYEITKPNSLYTIWDQDSLSWIE